jgi:hypothetical protein
MCRTNYNAYEGILAERPQYSTPQNFSLYSHKTSLLELKNKLNFFW